MTARIIPLFARRSPAASRPAPPPTVPGHILQLAAIVDAAPSGSDVANGAASVLLAEAGETGARAALKAVREMRAS